MIKSLLHLFLLFATCLNLTAQKLNFRYYNVGEGLPQATVYDIYQDKQGFLWFGTQGGVAKFDGKYFEVYNQKLGLTENHIVKIFQDTDNSIWLGHRYEGISKIAENSCVSYKGKLKELKSAVSCFTQIGENLIIGSEGSGLFILNLATLSDSVFKYKHYDISGGLSGDYINDFFTDRKGNLWIATDNGITILNPSLNFRTAFYLNNKNKLPAYNIKDIEIDERNYLWMVTDRGVFSMKYDDTKWIIGETIKLFNRSNGLPVNDAQKLKIDRRNTVWITSEQGIGKITGDVISWFNETNGLSSSRVSSVLVDRENTIWFGIYGTGACQYLGDNFSTFDKDVGLPSNMVQAVATDHAKNIWAGTDKGLCILQFSEKNSSILENLFVFTEAQGLPNDNIRVVFEDSRHWIWVGTDKGVAVKRKEEMRFRKVENTEKLAILRVNAVNEDNEGNIWLGAVKGGCFRLKIQNNSIKEINKYDSSDGLASDKIWTIKRNLKGELIFGTNDAGVLTYNLGKFSTLDTTNGLPTMRPGAFTEDNNGNLWIGSIGNGVIKYDIVNSMRSKNKVFKTYTTIDGIGSDNPYLLIGDNQNNIWIGTNYGVDRLNEKKDKIDRYGKNEGFSGIESNQNAVCKDAFGHLWFGTIKGLIRCKPEEIDVNYTKPTIHINGVRVLLKAANDIKNDFYPYEKNHLTFDYVGISLTDPLSVKYQYKLQGFDEDWLPVTNERSATYSNLSAGNYTFYVKSISGSGIESAQLAFYEFQVGAPFWKTKLFYLISALALFGMFYSIILLRTKSLKRHKRKLESIVQNRTRELIKEKDKVEEINREVVAQKNIIEQKNKDITDSINYAQRIQNSILPSRLVIQKAFPESFVLFKPKDIVSGDFYWFLNINGKFIVACVDCTGHGVPGAFMSVVGNDLLNTIVSDPKVSSPGQALTIMDYKVRKLLKQESSEVESPDGMDIALCAIDLESEEMQYAGAYRPIMLIRDKELYEYKPDKMSIGGISTSVKSFKNNTIKLQKGDVVYLFTDGYADQFGGLKKKKMMTKYFKNILLEIHEMPMKDQKKHLDKHFRDWKGDLEQIDDILVIGIKI